MKELLKYSSIPKTSRFIKFHRKLRLSSGVHHWGCMIPGLQLDCPHTPYLTKEITSTTLMQPQFERVIDWIDLSIATLSIFFISTEDDNNILEVTSHLLLLPVFFVFFYYSLHPCIWLLCFCYILFVYMLCPLVLIFFFFLLLFFNVPNPTSSLWKNIKVIWYIIYIYKYIFVRPN